MLCGLALEAVGLYYHARDLRRGGGEAAASHFDQGFLLQPGYPGRLLFPGNFIT